jgi:hypothetical protein
MGGQRKPEGKRLSEAALLAATGISRRKLIRRRQQGLVLTIEPRHGLGRGRGTTPLEYPLTAVATINRDKELSQTFRNIGERRWRLWLEGKPVRIAPDLADSWVSSRRSGRKLRPSVTLRQRSPRACGGRQSCRAAIRCERSSAASVMMICIR